MSQPSLELCPNSYSATPALPVMPSENPGQDPERYDADYNSLRDEYRLYGRCDFRRAAKPTRAAAVSGAHRPFG